MLSADRRFFAALRAREFPELDRRRLAYLDYTGAALPSRTQLRRHQELAQGVVLGNPHAEHAPSRASTEAIAAARAATLRFLDADPAVYGVCFTANASAAAKLVAEGFRFRRGELALSADNHNSVNGLREYARRAGARLRVLPLTPDLRLDDPSAALRAKGAGNRLLAFPAQSNFSGVRHPLALVTEAQRRGYAVLLDAAALVPTGWLSLRETTPEFVTLSFYKMFGFPTGVGALVARHDALRRLHRPWFAGGTVEWVSVRHCRHRLRSGIDGFEDGTPNFYGIAALDPGFAFLARVGMARLGRRVADLTSQLLVGLQRARHRDGAPLARLYGPDDLSDRGGTVAFNLLDRRGRVIPYDVVEARARTARGGARGLLLQPGIVRGGVPSPGGRVAALPEEHDRLHSPTVCALSGGWDRRRCDSRLGRRGDERSGSAPGACDVHPHRPGATLSLLRRAGAALSIQNDELPGVRPNIA